MPGHNDDREFDRELDRRAAVERTIFETMAGMQREISANREATAVIKAKIGFVAGGVGVIVTLGIELAKHLIK